MNVWVILTVCMLIGCSTHQKDSGGAGTSDERGILQGRVTIGPLRPGPVHLDQPEPEPPPELFEKHKVAVLTADGKKEIARVALDAKGNYRIELPPGDYLVDFVPHDIGLRQMPAESVNIQPGQTTILNLDIDTGMR